MVEHTVLQFTFIHFLHDWSRSGTVVYKALTAPYSKLFVVTESATGVKSTYLFHVRKNEEVLVSYDTNLAYIPSRCVSKSPGDSTSCVPE